VGPGRVALALLALAAEPTSTATATPTPTFLAALRAKVPIDPPSADPDVDPYDTWRGKRPPVPPPGTVCGVRFEPDRVHYRLATFPGEGAARAAGFAVTHLGACGTCSTMQDLAVYLGQPDLTAPVRRCGLHPTSAGVLQCLARLGLSPACARTWFWNARNTGRECLAVCAVSWVREEPSTTPDGKLNDCLQCDEDRSGPVFKAVAGRTRRNSGIVSSIPRPGDEVARIAHDYVPGAGQ
jgi:hypothetical protein